MGKIRQLPEYIISRIAAGEVIERPAYAIKELVENSLDAGATSISIQVEQGGIKKMVVSDNGEGMFPEDLLLAWKPHTTSKLEEDLVGIQTLGFRGEALSSLASVSDLVIQSRTKDTTAGMSIRLKAGRLQAKGPMGMPVGTTVTVSNLFSTVPARKKFIKSTQTEFGYIVRFVSSYALSHPEVRFILTHNKRVIFDVTVSSLSERIKSILGTPFFSQMFPISENESYLTISGFLAHPKFSTRAQSKQYLFVNKRSVRDSRLIKVIKEAYGNLLESTSNPQFILDITLPYEAVDVNIHPRKEQVTFLNAEEFYRQVYSVAKKTLENTISITQAHIRYSPRSGSTLLYGAEVLRESVTPWIPQSQESSCMLFHDTYIIFQTSSSLLLIDYHAAHERILYEQYVQEFKKKKTKMIHLSEPLSREVSREESVAIQENLKQFYSLGFKITVLSSHTVKISAVPELFQDRDFEVLLPELLEEIVERKGSVMDTVSERMIKFLACRTAVKSGDNLSQQEAQKIVVELKKTKNNRTCPHGRPTQIEISKAEFDKFFKR